MTDDPGSGNRRRSRVRKKIVIVTAVVAVVVAGGGGACAAFLLSRGDTGDTPARPPSVHTVAVRKMDLTSTKTIDGTLGYGQKHPLKGRGGGTLTGFADPGDVASRGKPLYWVDGDPVPVFFGGTPLYRSLDEAGIQGPDVAVVADNLAELGYATGTRAADPDEATLTETLVAAIKAWQRDTGLEPTGTLDVGQIVVLPQPVRVNAVSAQLGDPAKGEIMSVTSTTKAITAPIPATQAGKIKAGDNVTVIRPDNKKVPGKVTEIGDKATSDKKSESPGDDKPPERTVTIVPDDEEQLADLNYASVTVRITTVSHPDVLAVPTGALIALREGGYAVELPSGKLKAVQTGAFARGMVQIEGDGIKPGILVVTTS